MNIYSENNEISEADFLTSYQILEQAALHNNPADINARTSVELSTIINNDFTLENAEGIRFGIPISKSKSETSSTRDALINLVSKGFLKNNGVFKEDLMCLRPTKLLNTAAQRKSEYQVQTKLPMIGSFDKNMNLPPFKKSSKTVRDLPTLISVNHAAQVAELKQIRDDRRLKEKTQDHPVGYKSLKFKVINTDSEQIVISEPSTPEKSRRSQNLDESRDAVFCTPPHSVEQISTERFEVEESYSENNKENIFTSQNNFEKIPEQEFVMSQKSFENSCGKVDDQLSMNLVMKEIQSQMLQNNQVQLKRFDKIAEDINSLKNGEGLLTERVVDKISEKIVKSERFTKSMIDFVESARGKTETRIDRVSEQQRSEYTQKLDAVFSRLDSLELEAKSVAKNCSDNLILVKKDKDQVLRLHSQSLNEAADYTAAVRNNRNSGEFMITVVDHDLFYLDQSRSPQVDLEQIETILPFEIVTLSNPRASKAGNAMFKAKIVAGCSFTINKIMDDLMFGKVVGCSKRMVFALNTPPTHCIDSVLRVWIEMKIIFNYSNNGKGFYFLTIRDGDQRLVNDHSKKAEYVKSCTRLFVKNPRQMATIIKPTISQLRNMTRGLIFPYKGVFYQIPSFQKERNALKYMKPNFVSPHFTDLIEKTENQDDPEKAVPALEDIGNKIHQLKVKNGGGFSDVFEKNVSKSTDNNRLIVHQEQPRNNLDHLDTRDSPLNINSKPASFQPAVEHRNKYQNRSFSKKSCTGTGDHHQNNELVDRQEEIMNYSRRREPLSVHQRVARGMPVSSIELKSIGYQY